MILVKAAQTAKAKPTTYKSVLSASFYNLIRLNRKKSHSDRSHDQATQKLVIAKDNHFLGSKNKQKDKRSSLI